MKNIPIFKCLSIRSKKTKVINMLTLFFFLFGAMGFELYLNFSSCYSVLFQIFNSELTLTF